MHRLVIPLVLLALAASTEFAAARDGCGRGYFWNGYQCAPMGGSYRGGYGYGGYGYGGYGYGGYGSRVFPTAACYYYYGRRICCPGGFTVQDGVCKPYRGF